jgi:membrane-bound serine protease (ClpP class)
MAPTTHLGAATPVSITGDDVAPRDLDELGPEDAEDGADSGGDEADDKSTGSERRPTAMENKVMNDAVAYIRALAERHGRNADWAEEAVRDAATLTASEALARNVVEFLADDEEHLLRQLHGHEVRVGAETTKLDTEDASLVAFEPGWRTRLLSVISNPEIVLILGMIGLYGLMYEGWNPGAIVPGVVGVICLLLAAYALQIIPVNYAGLALIVVGLALMTAEAFAPSFGALGLGGVAAFVFGAIMMFDSDIPGFGISIAFVSLLGVLAALAIAWLVRYVLKLRKRGAVSGKSSIVGGIGTAMEDFTGNGRVWLEGEAWAAYSEAPLTKNQDVVVTSMEGLTLYVRPAPVQRPSTQLQT